MAYRERRKLNLKTGRDILTLELVEDGHLPDTAGNYLVGNSTISLPPNNNNLAAKNIRVATGRVNRSQGESPGLIATRAAGVGRVNAGRTGGPVTEPVIKQPHANQGLDIGPGFRVGIVGRNVLVNPLNDLVDIGGPSIVALGPSSARN